MIKYKPDEIFVPGGMPVETYVPRDNLRLEEKLISAMKNSHKFISITGTTKSGKTVLVSRICPQDKTVWFDGGAFDNEMEFWGFICEQLNIFTSVVKENGSETSIEAESEASGGIGPFASLRALFRSTFKRSESLSLSRSSSPKSKAIIGLRSSDTPLIIDDFHYIKREAQKSILRALKANVFLGKTVILLSIPHRKFDILTAERELTGRVESIPVPSWSTHELEQIAIKGFPYLNLDINKSIISSFGSQSVGSPNLMQEFCLGLCRKNGIAETQEKSIVLKSINEKDIYSEVALLTGKPVFDQLKRGPISRTARVKRNLPNKTVTDTYGFVLYALMNRKPGIETIEYDELRDMIKNVSSKNPPAMQDVSRVLDYMSSISLGDNASTPVLDWDKEFKRLHITDPYFSFYLRWGTFH